MHHPDYSADPPASGSRKAAYHYRRGSSGAPASNPGDDNNPTQAGSSSPGLQQQQVSGAQVKKKSGFQITSVTSAQINVSGNNSLADDTESYDDMDESHTEDLSSSDMLDVSVSRATDTGVPERSSSDETLNSLHGVDTPGLVSPNEPLQLQGSQQQTSLVNGGVHHHYYPHHHHSDSLGGGEPVLALSHRHLQPGHAVQSRGTVDVYGVLRKGGLASAAEAPKGAEVAAEAEAGNAGVQPPHTLQPYQPPTQDFTSPQAMQSPPQAYVSPQEVVMQKPAAPLALPTATPQPPYTVEAQQQQQGYPAPLLHSGVRQPDFIQPTAPFQTQVQPPLPHVTTGLPITPLPGVTAQPPLPHAPSRSGRPTCPPSSTPTPLHRLRPTRDPLHASNRCPATPPHPGSVLRPGPRRWRRQLQKTSQLEDAQKLLLQHQGLLGLPRLAAEAHGGCRPRPAPSWRPPRASGLSTATARRTGEDGRPHVAKMCFVVF
ncbi:TSC22 domain family protein 1 Regulatory protein TSC-22 [Larimichthys crocea]|uniref:TSC22 domain family protein 1 Regulatory protein TSC-22 n=1 Tax=Larimichthys crocea TaxID=215358 RepID=A0A6G0HH69_LARCR|nr:TSC22 domain family protein 1 Regulatory protein TSC-22 [Larimichthys crocea]